MAEWTNKEASTTAPSQSPGRGLCCKPVRIKHLTCQLSQMKKWEGTQTLLSPLLLYRAAIQQWHTSAGRETIPRRDAASGSENRECFAAAAQPMQVLHSLAATGGQHNTENTVPAQTVSNRTKRTFFIRYYFICFYFGHVFVFENMIYISFINSSFCCTCVASAFKFETSVSWS